MDMIKRFNNFFFPNRKVFYQFSGLSKEVPGEFNWDHQGPPRSEGWATFGAFFGFCNEHSLN